MSRNLVVLLSLAGALLALLVSTSAGQARPNRFHVTRHRHHAKEPGNYSNTTGGKRWIFHRPGKPGKVKSPKVA